jgi:cytochrome P450
MNAIPQIRDYDDVDYTPFTAMKDLGGEGSVRDFYPQLKALRQSNPVYDGDVREYFGLPGDLTLQHARKVTILGHKEVSRALQETASFSNTIYNSNLGVAFGRSVTTMDNPEHSRFRRLFQTAFSPSGVKKWGQEIIPRLINQLIDNFEERGEAELVGEFTLYFPFHFIHELMALPMEDRETFQRLAFGQIAISFDHEHGMDAIAKLKEYLTAVILERRANPREHDFMSIISTAEIDGERLPDDVVISFFRQLMNAGGDTSYNGFSTVLCALLNHPDQFEQVKQDRRLVAAAIEEGLRWNCPVPMIARTPHQELEMAGVVIRPGDHMSVMLAAANRDEAAFDRPDEFDISRASRAHAAFGYGPHICIGQHLARLEMANALNALLDRLPKLRADDRYPAPEVTGFSLRGPQKLHVRFD